jgi:hypothetical protein
MTTNTINTNTATAPALFPVEVAAAGRHHVLLVGPQGPDRLAAAMRIAAALPAGVPFVALDDYFATPWTVEEAMKAAEGGVLFVDRLDETGWSTPAKLMPAVKEGRFLLIVAVSKVPTPGPLTDRIYEHMSVRLPVAEVLAAHDGEAVAPVDAAGVELDDGGLEVMKAATMVGLVIGDVEWHATAGVAKTAAAMLGYRRVNADHVRAALAWRDARR